MKWLCPSSYLASLHSKSIAFCLFIFRSRCRSIAQIENVAAAAEVVATDPFRLQLITSFSNQIACDPIRIHVWYMCIVYTYIHNVVLYIRDRIWYIYHSLPIERLKQLAEIIRRKSVVRIALVKILQSTHFIIMKM